MYDLTALRERLRTQRPVPWDQLPDFSLYMDQVLSYMDRQVIRFDEDDGLTAAMVNNYTKSGLTPRAEGQYLSYLRAHAGEAAVWLVGERDMPGLAFLLRTAEPDREALSAACALARESGVSEALALLLEQQRDAAPRGLDKTFDL